MGAVIRALTAVSTGTGNPFDAHPVSYFQAAVLGAGAEFDDFAYTLVASYLGFWDTVWKDCPLSCVRSVSDRMKWSLSLLCWS